MNLKALVPALAWMALAALVGPRIPGSPIACVITHPTCHTNWQISWVVILILVVPFVILNLIGVPWKRRRRGSS